MAPEDANFIPSPLRSATSYWLHTADGYELLYRRLTNQPRTRKPELGKLRTLAPRDRKQVFQRVLPLNEGMKLECFAYDSSWVGREQVFSQLSEKLRGSCRLLLILGLTGIGKTALAERIAIGLENWFDRDQANDIRRANFDYEDRPIDFTSTAIRWLEEWGELLSIEDRKSEQVLQRLVKRLQENRTLVIIDSFERILTGNEEDGWGDFIDDCWEKFFLNLLSAESCLSRLIITSQDLPVKLIVPRYKNFWHWQVLHGLEEVEQEELFRITGLETSTNSPDKHLLMRIGRAYKGHPLVLRVIIGEILEHFDRNVCAYWNEVNEKIEGVENAIASAEKGEILGGKDEWKLHKLTLKVQKEVNKQYLETIFDRLNLQVKDAYILICTASVYRAPVQAQGWLMQLANFVKRLENQQCTDERQERALEELCNRFLVERSVNHNNKRVFGQHNLVRSVALERYKHLLKEMESDV